ncbi:hypothetical protein PGH26_09210 [Sporosarcina jeotgali]|uniref:EcsC family protein n=1 Tax=Sporosarcina jeotgali TaxID=3020056 RepID=A0ABZ0KSX6_9BACL|nr:hypothetical protein [Sporosarcina sp. B2O-1]WOV83108.1 hypothetical protein PGH26_09210 [Sporosarcina sp. B2O-1]
MGALSEENVGKVLEWSYNKVIQGIPGTDSAYELADNYLSKSSDTDEAINSLINWQTSKCATSGFVTGLGGVITMPVAIPANIASVIYVQMRMIAAIAYTHNSKAILNSVRLVRYTGSGSLNMSSFSLLDFKSSLLDYQNK